jgi:hypothetical protein
VIAAGSFVWVKGNRGPIPEKWPADLKRAAPTKPSPHDKVVLKEYPLGAEEFGLTIAILEQRYPKP